ncbi:unnamed protein product [Closterium sp. Naga37s-1]|nr:unnamed protein product [Closterium sp. Naga37s-1]
MGKGRNNKSGKKTADNAQAKDGIDVPDASVLSPAVSGRSPSSSASAAVLGPFEALLDPQNDVDEDAGAGGKEPDVAKETAGEEGTREEADAGDNACGEEDAQPHDIPDDEDDGYLSDDSDEHLEPDSLNCVIALKSFSLTLLVPILRKVEVTRAAVTVAALLEDWKESLTSDVLLTTTYQELTAKYFFGARFGRLQVTFNHVRDANFVWNQVIRHECVNRDYIDLTWQHPVDARFLRERVLNPTAKEVVVKGVPAEITAELIRRLLVVSKLVKRGKSAFASGFGFHRTVDPDPAVILTSTGGAREEWICVQTACEKAQGN